MTNTESTETEGDESVLEMRGVTLRDDRKENRLRNIDLTLKPGELTMVYRRSAQSKFLLANGILGILQPRRGEVIFQGTDWQQVPYAQRLDMRTKIGRIFDLGGWMQNLTLVDNILLSPRYHTKISDHELDHRMKELAAKLDLKMVRQRPAFIEKWRLRLFQWVRACIIRPSLIVAERPLAGVPPQYHSHVIQLVNELREQGSAVLWVTDNLRMVKAAETWPNETQNCVERYMIDDQKLVAFREPVE